MWKTVGKYRVYVAVALAFGLSAVFAYQALAQNPDIPLPTNIRVQSTNTSPPSITWTWDAPTTMPDGYSLQGYEVYHELADNPQRPYLTTNSFEDDKVNNDDHKGCSFIKVRTCTAVSGDVCTDYGDWAYPSQGSTTDPACLKSDLVVTDISIDKSCADADYTITATIENIGSLETVPTKTKFIANDITVCSAASTDPVLGKWVGNSQPNTKTVSCYVDCSQSQNSYACKWNPFVYP